ncbi:MAG: biosynthetic arginine decarboxylase [Gemmatimonadetes bacterium]|nr:biosynthetic arginine decarboxylase [Gemmatimonadota bacterium]
MNTSSAWSVKDAEKLYNMLGWGQGLFRVNTEGHVTVHPNPKNGNSLDLYRLALDLSAQGIQLPLLVRFSDILQSRVELLATEFSRAIEEFNYEGKYTTVYPIKVNQQRHVVEEIVQFGAAFGLGLECGSKPELQAVLGITDRTDHLIVCNGYKDEEFLRFALMAQKLGHTVFIVLEQPSELDFVLKISEEMGVEPTIGIRIKLATEGSGRWAKSGGEKSKFGLSAPQVLRLLERLDSLGKRSTLRLLHFHLGSQITDIRYVKAALEEIGRYYVEVRELGFDLTHVDVGGGLGVDYEGSRTTRPASMNYTPREYANDIIYGLGTICREQGIPMPNIISESGRALTAHHALLLVNVTDVEAQTAPPVPPVRPDSHRVLVELHENLEALTLDRVDEVFHDAVAAKERAQDLFASDALSLRELAELEELYLCTMNAIARLVAHDRAAFPEITSHIESALVDQYFCNFSVFQSLPDNWAIDQLFPIMPIHRLDEEPTRRGTLQDMTCDSDGVIDRFAGGRKGKPCLELHPYRPGEPYILGIFLTGAYQEILGDLHNLFGDTNAVHIEIKGDGYEITDLVRGDTVTEVLNYVQFSSPDLVGNFRRKVSAARELSRNEANAFIADYLAGLEGYTYLEGDIPVGESANG